MAVVNTQTRNIVYTHAFQSPVGTLHTAVDRYGRVLHLGFEPPHRLGPEFELRENKYACGEVEYQLEQYFAAERTAFSLELRLDGTSFQKAVWSRILKIDYGTTTTYSEIAQKIGSREAARAVGNAVAANPVLIIIPCHRVVPVGGGVGNYGVLGLDRTTGRRVKSALLALEGVGVGEEDIETPELEFDTA
jgi:methylated-DNA-[protein]-cysteine S-methyltransferase